MISRFLADEAIDISNDEQLSISIRYLVIHGISTGVTGQAIANDILLKLEKWQLQLQFLCGQAYDGAGAMAGKSNGAAACINAKQPKALNTHCASHMHCQLAPTLQNNFLRHWLEPLNP